MLTQFWGRVETSWSEPPVQNPPRKEPNKWVTASTPTSITVESRWRLRASTSPSCALNPMSTSTASRRGLRTARTGKDTTGGGGRSCGEALTACGVAACGLFSVTARCRRSLSNRGGHGSCWTTGDRNTETRTLWSRCSRAGGAWFDAVPRRSVIVRAPCGRFARTVPVCCCETAGCPQFSPHGNTWAAHDAEYFRLWSNFESSSGVTDAFSPQTRGGSTGGNGRKGPHTAGVPPGSGLWWEKW